MATLDTKYSSAPIGSEQRSNDLLSASQNLLSPVNNTMRLF